MLRGNIAATLLKTLLKNLYSVKCYDKLNMNVLTLSLWENFWWGLIYFDQFIFKLRENFVRKLVAFAQLDITHLSHAIESAKKKTTEARGSPLFDLLEWAVSSSDFFKNKNQFFYKLHEGGTCPQTQ